MGTVSHDQIIGIDVNRDWLDSHCLPNDQRLRLPNTAEGQGWPARCWSLRCRNVVRPRANKPPRLRAALIKAGDKGSRQTTW